MVAGHARQYPGHTVRMGSPLEALLQPCEGCSASFSSFLLHWAVLSMRQSLVHLLSWCHAAYLPFIVRTCLTTLSVFVVPSIRVSAVLFIAARAD